MSKFLKSMSLFFGLMLLLGLLSGCGVPNDPKPIALNIEDYYPIQENVRYVYEGIGNEYASYDVYIDYTSDDKIQQRVDNGGTVIARVIERKNGKLTRSLSRGETYHRENYLEVRDDTVEVLLMEPLEEGTTWTLNDGRKRSITNISADVTTPLGDYKAIEVVTEGPNDITTDYYAKDVGLVKSIFTSEGSEVSSSLKEIEEDASHVQVIQFYFPNMNDSKIYFKNKEVSFRTNDITSQILEEAYKGAIVDNLGEVFTTNTKINNLFLSNENKVMIDLNAAFVSEMNAGAQYESMILQSIANTFGQYFNAEEVVLTIENKPYESGHIEMKEGESIKVDLENAIELDV